MMTEAETALKTLETNSIFTQLITWENSIAFSCHESFKSYLLYTRFLLWCIQIIYFSSTNLFSTHNSIHQFCINRNSQPNKSLLCSDFKLQVYHYFTEKLPFLVSTEKLIYEVVNQSNSSKNCVMSCNTMCWEKSSSVYASQSVPF
jgi:hypothetical protein